MAIAEQRLAELERLIQEATEGPWTVRGRGGIHMDGTSDFYVVEARSEHRITTVAQVYQSGVRMERRANAELMVESRTAVPELIAEVRRLYRDIDVLREALTTLNQVLKRGRRYD